MSRFGKLMSVLLLLVTFILLVTPQAALAKPCLDKLESDLAACTNAFAWWDPRREACYIGAGALWAACIVEIV